MITRQRSRKHGLSPPEAWADTMRLPVLTEAEISLGIWRARATCPLLSSWSAVDPLACRNLPAPSERSPRLAAWTGPTCVYCLARKKTLLILQERRFQGKEKLTNKVLFHHFLQELGIILQLRIEPSKGLIH